MKTIAWSKLVKEHRGQLLAVGVCLLYLTLYLKTTHVEPQGMGGLSGPMEVRVFHSELHLLPFYPLYLAERWVRNESLTSASVWFNCDFADRLYVHHWLYGDGKYSWVWYDIWPFALGFIFVSLTIAIGLRQKSNCNLWLATLLGIVCGFAGIAAIFSHQAFKSAEWNGMTMKQRHGGGPVLELRMSEPGGGVAYGTRSAMRRGGGGSMRGAGAGDYIFEDQVLAIRTNSFLMMFRLKRPDLPDERAIIFFPVNTVTETNWNGWHIHGKFL